MTVNRRFLLVVPLALVLLFGCQSSRRNAAKVSGTVKYKGTLVTAGTVKLTHKDGGTYLLPINSDGTYSQSQLPLGECQVAIETESANPAKRMQYGGAKGGKQQMVSPRPEGIPAQEAKGAYVKIPDKYNDPAKSGLTVTLEKGDNQKDFDLTD